MILKATINDQLFELTVPTALLEQAEDFFAKMDKDMDMGWQVHREWVEAPDQTLRGQIAAHKLLTALENEDDNLGRMMAGYILTRLPEVETVELSRHGETRDHVFKMHDGSNLSSNTPSMSFSHSGLPSGLDKMQAMAQAGKDVSNVFKMGKQYRFTVFNHSNGEWEEAPAMSSKEDAEALREQAFKARFDALCNAPAIH